MHARLLSGIALSAACLCGAQPVFDYRAHPDHDGEFEIRSDVVYGEGAVRSGAAVKELEADVFLPKGLDGFRKAAILFVHGGGFRTGSRRNYHEECRYFARKGFVTVAIDYRKRGDDPPIPPREPVNFAAYPYARAALVDTKTALRWLHARAADFGIDPERIFMHGTSAGAIAALGAAVTGARTFADDFPGRPIPPSNWPGSSFRTRGIVDVCGGLYGLVDSLDADDPPILVYHGTQDRTVSFRHALAIRDRCRDVGLPCEFHPIEGGGHCPPGPAANGKSLLQLTHEFILKRLD